MAVITEAFAILSENLATNNIIFCANFLKLILREKQIFIPLDSDAHRDLSRKLKHKWPSTIVFWINYIKLASQEEYIGPKFDSW